jgi:glycosyltransferase involved in cell wall biosynthesis
MHESMLISIILPTYNRANYLQRAISSVFIQTYPRWELIVWDDGSTDNSAEIVRAYNDDRLRYFYDDNHGAAYARNRAIEVAQGEYLAFLDSDDEWRAGKLDDQVKAMLAFPEIEVLFSDFQNINTITQKKQRTFEHYSNAMKLLDVKQLSNDLFLVKAGLSESIATANIIATDTVMVRKEVFKGVGPFTEYLRNSEDFELWWRMGLAGVCFAYINKVYLTRYKPPNSLSNHCVLTYKNHLKALDICLKTAITKNRPDLVPYLNPLIRNAWMNMIPLYGEIGDRKAMVNAFSQSIKYGLTLGAIRLLIESFISIYASSGKKE